MSKKNRKHSIIDELPAHVKDTVEAMLMSNRKYAEIVDYLKLQGVGISPASVCRYAQGLNASIETLKIAQEDFRRIADVLEKFPNMDPREVLIRIQGLLLMNAGANVSESDVAAMKPKEIMRETSSFIRAVTYSKVTDERIRDSIESALNESKNLLFDVIARKDPDTYAKVLAIIQGEMESYKAAPVPASGG